MPGDPLPPGRIYNSNRFTLNGLAQAFDCEVRDYGIVPDSLGATREVLRRAAAECDVIVNERRRFGGRCRFRQARGGSRGRAAHVAHFDEARTAARVRARRARELHRVAGQSRVELRDLPHIRSSVPAEDARDHAGGSACDPARADFDWPEPTPAASFCA